MGKVWFSLQVGRPKSALAVNSPEATEKSRRSPGTVSVSSSSSGDTKKKPGRGKAAKTVKEPAASAPAESVSSVTPAVAAAAAAESPPATPSGWKRRKTSASETHSESSYTECDITPVTTAAVDSALATPPTVASPTADLQMNFSSLDVKPHLLSPPPPSSLSSALANTACLSPKPSPGHMKLESSPGPSSAVRMEPPRLLSPAMMAKMKQEEPDRGESPKPAMDKASSSRRRDKENVKLELEDIRRDPDEKFEAEPDPEPKPDHVLVDLNTWKSARYENSW